MGRAKRKNSQQKSTGDPRITVNIDYKQLANAIVEAHDVVAEKEHQQSKAAYEKWNENLGFKDYSSERNVIVRTVGRLVNDFSMLIHLLFFKKQNADADYATISILKTALNILFTAAKWLCYGSAIILLFVSVYFLIQLHWGYLPLSLLLAGLCWFLGRIFRVVVFEIENMYDKPMFITVLSAVTSFAAMMLALIALFVR